MTDRVLSLISWSSLRYGHWQTYDSSILFRLSTMRQSYPRWSSLRWQTYDSRILYGHCQTYGSNLVIR
jgi:hypothetical protein